LALTGGVTGLAFVIERRSWLGEFLPQISVILALATAAAAGSAAIAAAAVSRLSADRRTAWVGAGMLLYALVAVPSTAIGSAFESVAANIGIARLTAHTLVVIVLLLACRPPRRLWRVRVLVLFGVGMLITTVAVGVATVAPGWALAFSGDAAPRYVVVTGWLLAGVVLTAQGFSAPGRAVRAASPPTTRIGVGVSVMALAHLYRILSEPAQPVTAPGLVFSIVRLVGVLLVLLGLISWALHTLSEAQDNVADREEQLQDATAGLDRITQRDHELRHSLAALVDETRAWNVVVPEEKPRLAATVTTELARLNALLDHQPTQPHLTC
jgi:two-component system OmpR family sensor kinase